MANETLGDVVRDARLRRGLGLRQLASIIQKTPSYLSDIENDRRVPAEDVLSDLARELSLDFDELMSLAGRFGEQAERYLKRQPEAARLFRRISAANLPADDLRKLIDAAEDLARNKGDA
ncbi:MAG: helix-turn-helix transcriptional regulator [Dehalococcoidia bacterium]|nr:helix-turn-helix transcriptional regulator [Dehalococcoidia bacterium]